MNKELKNILGDDIYRYTGKRTLSFKNKLLMRPTLKYILLFRKSKFWHKRNKLFHYINRYKLYRLQIKHGININWTTDVGAGLYIGHLGPLSINADAKVGKNVNITAGVTIGATNRGSKMGVPTVGNNVWIGTNAVVVGKITIGDDVLIAPNSYVNFDVPAHSIVLGNPATVHPRENATEGYINRTV